MARGHCPCHRATTEGDVRPWLASLCGRQAPEPPAGIQTAGRGYRARLSSARAPQAVRRPPFAPRRGSMPSGNRGYVPPSVTARVTAITAPAHAPWPPRARATPQSQAPVWSGSSTSPTRPAGQGPARVWRQGPAGRARGETGPPRDGIPASRVRDQGQRVPDRGARNDWGQRAGVPARSSRDRGQLAVGAGVWSLPSSLATLGPLRSVGAVGDQGVRAPTRKTGPVRDARSSRAPRATPRPPR